MSILPDLDPRSTGATVDTRADVSVIVVTHQSRRFIDACIDSLAPALVGCTYETIVVDNESRDGTPDHIRSMHPRVRVVEAGRNAGFATASNIGIFASTGRHVVLFNPDAVAGPGSLARMVALLDTDPMIGAVGPRLLNPDLTDQGTARSFPTPAAALLGRRSPLTRLWPGNPWTRRYLVGSRRTDAFPFDIDWMSGACLMARREVVAEVGPLDGRYFMYWEDADWCRRIKDAGMRVVCEPRARVVHDEGAARGRPARQSIWFHRSAYRYYAKHHLAGNRRPWRAVAATALAARGAFAVVNSAIRPKRSP